MDDLLGEDPGLPVLHDRDYRVRAYASSTSEILVRGAVRDVKPPGVFLVDDPDPITIHHMVVELRVAFPSLEITGANVAFEIHPHTQCPLIIDTYQSLVGLSITRGFTHQVRELFGGPRGCTHTTALLYAMAPVVVQCSYSMRTFAERDGTETDAAEKGRSRLQRNLDTCRAWSSGSELMTMLENGAPVPPPIPLQQRIEARGMHPGPGWDWTDRTPGTPR